MKKCLMLAVWMMFLFPFPARAAKPPVRPFERSNMSLSTCRIDSLVFGHLREMGIQPANLCSDAVFVRRVYLDVIGTLPKPPEVRAFLKDRDPDKRRALIDSLLDRDAFADYRAMKWADLLRIKSEFPINLWPNAVQAYHRWVRTSLRKNKPYDQLVREMLTASGSNFRDPPVNFYRAVEQKDPQGRAKAVALTFMGARAEGWPEDRLSNMAAFFSRVGVKKTAEWKEEIVFFNPQTDFADSAVFPDGTRIRLGPDADPRVAFANWLIQPDNPWFARAAVNRIWFWLLGRGIVHEPDDIRTDNPPVHPALLDYLASELVTHGYDLKHIYRLILNSQVYQLSAIPRSKHSDAEKHFACYSVRRLEAEVLADALCQLTGSTETYMSAIPEPFTFVPEHQRSIALTDGSITSSFLELFGRPPRDTGLLLERSNAMTTDQRLHLLNSSHIRRKIERSRLLRPLARANRTPQKVLNTLYLAVLSRYPTKEEREIARTYFQSDAVNRREAVIDLFWTLINSSEFLYRH